MPGEPKKYGGFTIKPSAKSVTGGPSGDAAFNAILNRYTWLKKYRDTILAVAGPDGQPYGITSAQLAAVLATEAGVNADGSPRTSSAGAYGIAQIADTSARPVNTNGVPYPGKNPAHISREEKADTVFGIRYMAWRIGGDLAAGYTLGQAWGGFGGASPYAYNGNYANTSKVDPVQQKLDTIVPGYNPTKQTSNVDRTALDEARRNTDLAYDDPYVNANGQPVPGAVTRPKGSPASGIIANDGMRRSEFNKIAQQLNTDYRMYANRDATPREIAEWATGKTSIWTVRQKLAGQPVGKPGDKFYIPPDPERQKEFLSSPIYEAEAGKYINAWQGIHGVKSSPPQEMLTRAVVLNKDVSGFQAEVRALPGYGKSMEAQTRVQGVTAAARSIAGPRYTPPGKLLARWVAENLSDDAVIDEIRRSPEYVKTNEYQKNFAGNYRVFNQIYGRPDEQGKEIVRQAALNQWTSDQFGQYLRSQPGYTQSPEYQAKALDFLDAMGLITGDTAVLRQGVAPRNEGDTNPLVRPAGQGESKNEPPFTRADRSPAIPRKAGRTLVAQSAGMGASYG